MNFKSGDQFIMYEVFISLHKPNYKISLQHFIMKCLKIAGVRVGPKSVADFFKLMQDQGFGTMVIDDNNKNKRHKDRYFYKYAFMCDGEL